jgi:hypothetical protein
MAQQTKVVADGLEAPTVVHRTTRWPVVVAGGVIGFGIAFLLFGADPLPPSESVGGQLNRADSGEVAPGIGEVVPGFKDGLALATSKNGNTVELTIWPSKGPQYEIAMPFGNTGRHGVAFDSSGQRVATLVEIPGELGVGLVAGVPESAALVDTGVTGTAWHDSQPGLIAYTTFEAGRIRLWTMGASETEPQLKVSRSTLAGGLSAWGEWGFAVQDESGPAVAILEPSGLTKVVHSGRLLGSDSSGRLVLFSEEASTTGELSVFGPDGLVFDFGDRFRSVGTPQVAEISPDGRRLAVLGDRGLLVLAMEGDSEPLRVAPRDGVSQITWGSDSRFLLIPEPRGLTILDSRGGRLDYLLGDRTVLGVSVLPPNS